MHRLGSFHIHYTFINTLFLLGALTRRLEQEAARKKRTYELIRPASTANPGAGRKSLKGVELYADRRMAW